MLQYILRAVDSCATGELAQMAIEGGCRWISISPGELDDAALREALVPDVVEMCRQAGVFLTIDDRPALARDLGVHGVRLGSAFFTLHPGYTLTGLRDELGPEAVIGVECADPTAIPDMMPADIDFVSLPAQFSREQRRDFVARTRVLGVGLPLVAQGIESPAQGAEAIADGCNGVAVGAPVTDAADPVAAMRQFLAAL